MMLWIGRSVLIRWATNHNRSKIYQFSVRRNASTKQEAHVRPKNMAAVTALLREYGFTDAHISRLQSRNPCAFELSCETNLSPKLKFVDSICSCKADIPKFVLHNQYLLLASLEKRLIPTYSYIKNLCKCEEKLKRSVMRHPRMLTANLGKTIAPNVQLLRSMGVPSSVLTYSVTCTHFELYYNHETIKSSVDQVLKIGLNPSTKMFIFAVGIMCRIGKQRWTRKLEVYRGFGLSNDEVVSTFRKQPLFMAISEEKISKVMEFVINELGWTPAAVAQSPMVLMSSLERRVIPRCRVMEILRKKGLSNASPSSFLMFTEEKFLDKYVHKHKEDLPDLMEIYKRCNSSQRKINSVRTDIQSPV